MEADADFLWLNDVQLQEEYENQSRGEAKKANYVDESCLARMVEGRVGVIIFLKAEKCFSYYENDEV